MPFVRLSPLMLGLFALFLLFAGWSPAATNAQEGAIRYHLPLMLSQSGGGRGIQPPPTATPIVTATPTPGNNPQAPADWLGRLNYYRSLGGLPPVTENATWSAGAVEHSRYMVKNDITHTQDPSNPWYTPAGYEAGRNGNIAVSSSHTTPDSSPIDLWLTGPFHQVGLLDPRLSVSGFGSYREQGAPRWGMGATLDVLRGRSATPGTFPVLWPQGLAHIPLTYRGGEYPDPLSACPGYTMPSGAPLVVQLGTGSVTPVVTVATLTRDGVPVELCLYDETSYVNPNEDAQDSGRAVLNARDAVVLMPRDPLVAGATYEVTLLANGQTHRWSFTPIATDAPVAPALMEMGPID